MSSIFNRTIISQLAKWKADSNRKPLILRGARQVGKTTAVNYFSKQYDQYIYLNLEVKSDRDLFTQGHDIDDLIKLIFFQKEQVIEEGKQILIFIDEIQNSPEAAAMLRYFYEKRPEFHVIVAGSLLETLMDTHVSFPVGRVDYRFMYPLSFVEFLQAYDKEQALSILNEKPSPSYAHDELLNLFYRYTLIGGLPEAVHEYVKDEDVTKTNRVYQNLMLAYMDDVEKYAQNRKMIDIIRHCIEHAPLNAGSRIKFEGFGRSNYKSREVGEALRTLEKAMLIKLVYPTTATIPPIEAAHNKSPKIQFLDTGLVNFTAGLQEFYFALDDLNNIYKGRIAEHIVGQEFLAMDSSSNNPVRFWVRESSQSRAEIDFIIPYEKYLIPVEVKSGVTGTLKSLHLFMDKVEHSWAVRVYAGPYKIDDCVSTNGKKYQLLNLPFYLAHQIKDYIGLMIK